MAYDKRKLLDVEHGKMIMEALLADYDGGNTSAEKVKYKDSTVEDVLNSLLYNEIEIVGFANSIVEVEIGSTVDECTFVWELNKTPDSLLLDGSAINVNLREYTLTNMGLTLSEPGEATFTLTASDEDGKSISYTYIFFDNGVYYGTGSVAEEDKIDDTFLQGLDKKLTNKRETLFTVDAGAEEFIYFALPSRLGTPTFYVGGIEGGFCLARTFDYTNASGYTESYDVYRSVHVNLGDTTVAVA